MSDDEGAPNEPSSFRSIAPAAIEATNDASLRVGIGWLRSFALALAIGTGGGALFSLAGFPLAWMLGAMTACGAAAMWRIPIAAPKRARPPMSALIGTMLGTQFGAETLATIIRFWPALLGLAGFLICGATLCYFYLSRVVRLDPITSYFCAMPGGLIDMVLLGSERGGDERTIALIHSSRIFLTVISLPAILAFTTHSEIATGGRAFIPISGMGTPDVVWFFTAFGGGIILGRVARIPAPFLIGPMLVSAGLHAAGITEFVMPSLLLYAAQVVLGVTVGCRFAGVAPRRIANLLLISAGSTAILLTVSLVFALALHALADLDIVAVLLAYAPGGLAEMSLVALSLNVEVAFVVVCHMSRIVLVIGGATLFLKR